MHIYLRKMGVYMNNVEYIVKNARKADTILRKIAFPNTSRSFASIDDIEFCEVFEPEESYMAICEENKIIVNTHHFNCWNKKYCDKKLIETLMHELIHHFIGCWIDDKDYIKGFSADNSPIFILFVMWFNSRLKDYKIGINSKTASSSVKTFYDKEWDIILNGNFLTLYRECLNIANGFNNVLQEFNADLRSLDEKICVAASFSLDDTQGDKDAFYSGVYSLIDNNLIIRLSTKYYNYPELFRIDLEEMIDCLLFKIDDRFVFDEENCSLDYSFKYIDIDERN